MRKYNEELCAPSERGKPRQRIKGKISKRGAWGHEASKAMHGAACSRIDFKEAKRKARLEARAERKARIQVKNAERGQEFIAA